MTDTRRFAAVFATTAAVAALAGGIGGLVLGQSHHAAPTTSPVSEVGAAQTPAVAPVAVQPATPTPVAIRTVTRTVIVKQSTPKAPVAPKPTAAKPAKESKVTEPQTEPVAPVQAVDPTPDPTPAPNYDQPEGPWQKGGTPTSMNGTPDPQVGGTTPTTPPAGTLPMHPDSE